MKDKFKICFIADANHPNTLNWIKHLAGRPENEVHIISFNIPYKKAFNIQFHQIEKKYRGKSKYFFAAETIREKVNLINKYNIDIMAFFIVGYPTETRETILQTIKFAKELKIKRAHFSTFLPLPGTDATNQLLESGKIEKIDWSSLFYTKAPLAPEGMTPEELKKLQRKAFLQFYFRPKIMYSMTKEINSWTHFKSLLKRSVDYAFDKG